MAGLLTPRGFGPFSRVVDSANPSVDLNGALKAAKGITLLGAGKITLAPGTSVVLTLKDDQATPASVTSVCAVVPFADGALAVAHSTSTNKVYVYRLLATMDGWIDSGGTTHASNSTPQPMGVLWSTITSPPDVTIAEGLGVAYIAHTVAADSATLAWPTKTYTDSTRAIATYQADLDGGGAKDVYALGTISFQQHLWFWGFGSGATAATGFRPELARFSTPSFGSASASDSITLGDRVRSVREKIVGGGVAGEALFLGGPFYLTRVTGYGRLSWYKQPLDKSFGFVGPKCMIAVGDTLYYWSSMGPMRVQAQGAPEPLWEPIVGFAQSVINPEKIVAGYDEGTDTVHFACDTSSGVRSQALFQVRRSVWIGISDDIGLVIRGMGSVSSVVASTATGVSGPAGAPTSAVTSSVGATSAVASWTTGDATALTQVEYRRQADTAWTVATSSLAAGVTTYTLSGLTPGVAYEWRAAHLKNGQFSSYLGPVAGSQFTTSTTLLPPTGLALTSLNSTGTIGISWTNAGESGISTEVYVAGPSASPPNPALYLLDSTAGVGISSTTTVVDTTGTYWVKIRHVKSGVTASSYDGPVSLAVTVS